MAGTPKLAAIADVMRRQMLGEPHGRRVATLEGGLQARLARDGAAWRLALWRERAWPSETECRLCTAAFGVPEGTEQRRRTAREQHPKTLRMIEYRIVEFSWREYPVPAADARSGEGASACAATG